MENSNRPYQIKKEDLIPFVGAFRYIKRLEDQYQRRPPAEASLRLLGLGAYNAVLGLIGAGAILGLEKLLN